MGRIILQDFTPFAHLTRYTCLCLRIIPTHIAVCSDAVTRLCFLTRIILSYIRPLIVTAVCAWFLPRITLDDAQRFPFHNNIKCVLREGQSSFIEIKNLEFGALSTRGEIHTKDNPQAVEYNAILFFFHLKCLVKLLFEI